MILNSLIMIAGLILGAIAFVDYYSGEIACACFRLLLAGIILIILAIRCRPNICYQNCNISFLPPSDLKEDVDE